MNALLKKYNKLEDINDHNGAALLLIKNFGTDEELTIMKGIIERTEKNGFIENDDYRLRYEISQPYYKRLFN